MKILNTRLTLQQDLGVFKNGRMGIFVCECGQRKILNIHEVKRLKTRSCGCLQEEQMRKNLCSKKGHGYRHHPLYQVWAEMLARCRRLTNKAYPNYGGRGISVCKQWEDPKTFIEWCLCNGWERGLQLDRINNDGNYEPSNCRFVTRLVNSNNKRSNIYITHKGETKTITQWAEHIGVNRGTLNSRLIKGFSIDDCLSPSHFSSRKGYATSKQPIRGRPKYKLIFEYNGKETPLKEICREENISYYFQSNG